VSLFFVPSSRTTIRTAKATGSEKGTLRNVVVDQMYQIERTTRQWESRRSVKLITDKRRILEI
jgi:hypothetical protein